MDNRLKKVRKAAGLTQKEVSEALNIPQNTLSNYENGKRKPSRVIWKVLADYFGVPVGYLQGITNSDETNAFENAMYDEKWAKKFAKIIDSDIEKGSEKYDIIAKLLLDKNQLTTTSNVNNVDKDDIYNYVNSIFKYMTFESLNGQHQTLNQLKAMVKNWRKTGLTQNYSNWVKGQTDNANGNNDND